MDVFDFVNDINGSKKNLMRESENDALAEKIYDPFIVNRSLSYFVDCILFVQELNKYNGIDKKLQYEFLLEIVRPMKRRGGKWPKPDRSEDLKAIQLNYQLSTAKALVALSILTSEQIAFIKEKQNKGGME